MKKTKQEKGITLVALIITIIVLLILVAVTIAAVQGDGIIANAKKAKQEQIQKQDEEEIMLAVNDWKIAKNTQKDKTFTGFMGEKFGAENVRENEDESLEITMESGNKYTVTETGKITYINPVETPGDDPVIPDEPIQSEDETELELMKKYVLGGEEGTGRVVTDIINLNTSTMQVTSFINDEESIKDASTTITPLYTAYGENQAIALAYAKYNDKVYKIVADFTTYMTQDVEMVYKPEGREGTPVEYDSDGNSEMEDWVIITDRGGKVEIVSANAMGSLALGGSDAEISNNLDKYLDIDNDGKADDLDGDETIGDEGDIAIASYNNAITRINDYCKEIVTTENDDKVRSIGSSVETGEDYSSTNFNSWFRKKDTVKVRKADTNFEQDLSKLFYFGISGADYWTASRVVSEDSSYVNFNVRTVSSDGIFGDRNLWDVISDGNVSNYYPSHGVRPVVINPSGI